MEGHGAGAEGVFERPRLKRLRLRNYRSIGDDWEQIDIPQRHPLVLLGENNAGKSNLIRALDLVLGERWPGNHEPEDHEVHGRDPEGLETAIHVQLEDMPCYPSCGGSIDQIIWKYSRDDDEPTRFFMETTGCSHSRLSNDLRRSLTAIVIGGDRSLSYQMSYASKFTSLSKLMHRFHERLVQGDGSLEQIKAIFGDLVDAFDEVPEFSEFRKSLKTYTERFGGNLPYGLDIDFSAYDASNFFRSLRIFPQLGGEARAYEEMGSGQQQVLALAFSYAYARAFGDEGVLLCIEEPETNLHPLAQRWLAARFEDVIAEGVQIVLTTHSPSFVNLTFPGTTVLVRKADEQSSTVAGPAAA